MNHTVINMGLVLIFNGQNWNKKNFVLRKRLSYCESLLNTFGTWFQTIVVILKYDRDYKNLVNYIPTRDLKWNHLLRHFRIYFPNYGYPFHNHLWLTVVNLKSADFKFITREHIIKCGDLVLRDHKKFSNLSEINLIWFLRDWLLMRDSTL